MDHLLTILGTLSRPTTKNINKPIENFFVIFCNETSVASTTLDKISLHTVYVYNIVGYIFLIYMNINTSMKPPQHTNI